MPRPANLEGMIFGKLTVTHRAKSNNGRMWACACECGGKATIRTCSLVGGDTKSCGCGLRKHGKSDTTEYQSWKHLRGRCNNPNEDSYEHYGGRGIVVCKAWNDYNVFLDDMGLKPTPKHQIDRIDNNGNYEPNNCRWVAPLENLRNTRRCRWWFVDGVRYDSVRHAAKELGVAATTIRYWCESSKNDCYSELKYASC